MVVLVSVAYEAALSGAVFDEDGIQKLFDNLRLCLSRSRIVVMSQVEPEQRRLIEQQQVSHLPATRIRQSVVGTLQLLITKFHVPGKSSVDGLTVVADARRHVFQAAAFGKIFERLDRVTMLAWMDEQIRKV